MASLSFRSSSPIIREQKPTAMLSKGNARSFAVVQAFGYFAIRAYFFGVGYAD